MNLQQDDKQRIVMMYPPFSPEDILCVYLKRVLDRKFHITYPNRNNYMRSVFDTVCALKDMSDFTIYKFDFSDFFNSVSSIYVYQKYIQDKGLERFNAELLKRFVYDTKYTYAGLNTSNILCEIIAKEFDELLMQKLSKSGVILYKRYIDDGIVIFNRYISKDDCLKNVNEAIKSIFYDSVEANIPSCKTKVNSSKSAYISRRLMTVGLYSFDFLGYEFEMSNKVVDGNEKITVRYGITQKKIDKYSKRIADIVKDYAPTNMPAAPANINGRKLKLSSLIRLSTDFFNEDPSSTIWIFLTSSSMLACVNFGTSCTKSTTPITPKIYAIPCPTDTISSYSAATVAFAAENAGVDVREPDRSPTTIAVSLSKSASPVALPTRIHTTADNPPARMIISPSST